VCLAFVAATRSWAGRSPILTASKAPPGESHGLGLLDVATVLDRQKILRFAAGRLASGASFQGYEMHMGRTTGVGTSRSFLTLDDGTPDGAISEDGRIGGAYVHGLFASGAARAALLTELEAGSTAMDQGVLVDRALDDVAAALECALDIPTLARIAGITL
jgi:adenosylcobyric acid synthase